MALESHQRELAASLAKANLVPGSAASLIPKDFLPFTRLSVSYSSKTAELGTFFRAGECKLAPAISFLNEDDTKQASYTLILTDPDAPTPDDPKYAFWRHWVIPGLQPLSGNTGVVAMTKPSLTEYLGPSPKDDSKPHRYLFLLYREPVGFDPSKEDIGGDEFEQRRSFKPAEWAKNNGLVLVDVNWMTCAGDGWKEPSLG